MSREQEYGRVECLSHAKVRAAAKVIRDVCDIDTWDVQATVNGLRDMASAPLTADQHRARSDAIAILEEVEQ
jgi:hypothetical protein